MKMVACECTTESLHLWPLPKSMTNWILALAVCTSIAEISHSHAQRLPGTGPKGSSGGESLSLNLGPLGVQLQGSGCALGSPNKADYGLETGPSGRLIGYHLLSSHAYL